MAARRGRSVRQCVAAATVLIAVSWLAGCSTRGGIDRAVHDLTAEKRRSTDGISTNTLFDTTATRQWIYDGPRALELD
ncbi:MAG: hypothetical protein O3A51_06500, partial [Verrucomicrobia bacterium]|nr:hypothetical protein [Verrucomicrobiota bacterium]